MLLEPMGKNRFFSDSLKVQLHSTHTNMSLCVSADVSKPLMGRLQEERGTVSLPANCPSQAIVDVSENMRAKIYSLFCKIGFTDLPGLGVEDHVTLTTIEKYLDFKMGEVWTETMKELEVGVGFGGCYWQRLWWWVFGGQRLWWWVWTEILMMSVWLTDCGSGYLVDRLWWWCGQRL